MVPDEFRNLVAEIANHLVELLDDSGVQPSHEVTMAFGLLFAVSCQTAGITKEAYLAACEDAYENAQNYAKSLEETTEAAGESPESPEKEQA